MKISLEVPEGSGAEVSAGSGADTWVPVQIPVRDLVTIPGEVSEGSTADTWSNAGRSR